MLQSSLQQTLLCYTMQCYAVLCYVMLYYAMLCYTMLCYAMLCYAVLYYPGRAVEQFIPDPNEFIEQPIHQSTHDLARRNARQRLNPPSPEGGARRAESVRHIFQLLFAILEPLLFPPQSSRAFRLSPTTGLPESAFPLERWAKK